MAADQPRLLVKSLVAALLAVAAPARGDVRVSAGGSISDRGEAFAGDAEVHASVLAASVRYADRLTALVGFGPRLVRRAADESRWNARCVEAMRASGDRSCWVAGVEHVTAPRAALDGWFGAGVGARRDGAHTQAIAAVQLYPLTTRHAEVELAMSALVAGPVDTYVHHARFAPGWYARARFEHAHVFAGGEAGMTGFAARTSTGTLRAETYAIATLGVSWEL